jgi:hypothetical protein
MNDWKTRATKAIEKIRDKTTLLSQFLRGFLRTGAAGTPRGERIAKIVWSVIKRLDIILTVANTISEEISKEKINWERIKEIFPTKDWLDAIADALSRLDRDQFFRIVMLSYRSNLKDYYLTYIYPQIETLVVIFGRDLGHQEIIDAFYEAPKSPTEEEMQMWAGAHQGGASKSEELLSLFEKISQILINELGNLADKEALSEYLRSIGDQLEDALLTVDAGQYRRKLLRVSEDVRELFESLRVDRREAHREAFNSFFNAVSESIKKIYTSPLMKFILLRRLLGLRG